MDTRTDTISHEPANLGGQKLRKYRRKLAETQTQFGKRYGLTANAISRYERGENLPELLLATRMERDGICACQDWSCDPHPTASPPVLPTKEPASASAPP